MKVPGLKSAVQYTVFLGLGIFLIWYSVKSLTAEEKQKLMQSFAEVDYLYILPVVFILMLSHLSRAYRWKMLMEPLGYHPRLANTFIAVLLGYLFNLLVPRLGEVMKCTLLARYEKIAPDKLIGTIVAERAFDVVCLLTAILIMLITQWNTVGKEFTGALQNAMQNSAGETNYTKLMLIAGIIVLVVLSLRFVFKRFGSNKIISRIGKAASNIWQGLSTIKKLRKPGLFLFHTVFIWACYLGSIWAGFYAFAPVGNMGLGAALSVLVFGSLGMIVTQGGIGAYQIAVQRTLGLYGISMVAGLSFGWILWGAQTLIVIVFGAIALVVLPVINRPKDISKSSN